MHQYPTSSLPFQTLILEEHFKRQDNEPKQEVDLDNLVGLGHMVRMSEAVESCAAS